MRIEFDPTNPTEAAAVRAMLTAMAPKPVGETTRGLIVESAKVSQAAIGTLRVGPLVEKLDEYSVQREAIPTGVTDDGWQTVEAEQVTDSNGEPHDPRIHSTPPKLNADGTWRAKRGVTAEQIAAVRAERESTQPVALAEETVEEHIAEVASIVATDGAGMTVSENPGTGERTVSVEAEQFVVTAPPAPPITTAPPAPIATGTPSFLDVMKAITAAQKDGKIDTAKVKELCAAVGAGESTMGLNGPDNGDKRVAFMALLASEVAA